MRKRVYVDTSVIGGYFDEEFRYATRLLFERLERDEIRFVVSDLLDIELQQAPRHVSGLLLNLSSDRFERVEMTSEVMRLADHYIIEKVVGKSSVEDCRHIALATVSRVDALVSWNFKHIVHADRIIGFNSINLKYGYPIIDICTPQQII